MNRPRVLTTCPTLAAALRRLQDPHYLNQRPRPVVAWLPVKHRPPGGQPFGLVAPNPKGPLR